MLGVAATPGGDPAVFIAHPALADAKRMVRSIEAGSYLGVIVVPPIDTGDPVGIFVCVLPQPASDLEKEPSGGPS